MNENAVDLWLTQFDSALKAGDVAGAVALFRPDAAWRDLLAFTWNIVTLEGPARIAAMLGDCLSRTTPTGWHRVGPAESDGEAASAWITFTTATAQGTGRLTLRDGLADVLFTAIADLTGHEEKRGATRPKGIVHEASRTRETWSEARTRRRAQLGAGSGVPGDRHVAQGQRTAGGAAAAGTGRGRRHRGDPPPPHAAH